MVMVLISQLNYAVTSARSNVAALLWALICFEDQRFTRNTEKLPKTKYSMMPRKNLRTDACDMNKQTKKDMITEWVQHKWVNERLPSQTVFHIFSGLRVKLKSSYAVRRLHSSVHSQEKNLYKQETIQIVSETDSMVGLIHFKWNCHLEYTI